MKIKTWRDPYDIGVSLTEPKEIEINPGLTVLVGCNGSGKSTLLRNIKDFAFENKLPCVYYNNLSKSSSDMLSSVFSGIKEFEGDNIEDAVSIWSASEGEAIRLNVKRQSSLYEEFLNTGFFKDAHYRFSSAFRKGEDGVTISNIRVFLYDATDSGLSIDAVCDLKRFFNAISIVAEGKGLETYIIVAANEYELCRKEPCFDVVKGTYITFSDYEEYRDFILKSRIRKSKRIEKQLEYAEKQKKKEEKQWSDTIKKYQKLYADISADSTKDRIHRKWELEDLQRSLDDIRRKFRYYDAPEYILKTE